MARARRPERPRKARRDARPPARCVWVWMGGWGVGVGATFWLIFDPVSGDVTVYRRSNTAFKFRMVTLDKFHDFGHNFDAFFASIARIVQVRSPEPASQGLRTEDQKK